jgi:hypothetical protein
VFDLCNVCILRVSAYQCLCLGEYARFVCIGCVSPHILPSSSHPFSPPSLPSLLSPLAPSLSIPSLSGDCVDCRDLVLAQGALPALLQVSSVSAVHACLPPSNPSFSATPPPFAPIYHPHITFPLFHYLLNPLNLSHTPPSHTSSLIPPSITSPSHPTLSLITHRTDLQRTLPPIHHP